MQRIFTLLALFFLYSFSVSAQYTTPGIGVSWTLDSLVANSSGAVTVSSGDYLITQDMTIAATDSLFIHDNVTVKFGSGVLVTVFGAMDVNPTDSVLFTRAQAGQFYKSFKFEDGSHGLFKKTIVEYGGGIRILYADLMFDSCTIRYHNTSNSTSGAFALFNSNTTVKNSHIHDNAGPAFGGGANIANAPLILNNQIINNNTANSNKPQINMGGTGADTIKIIGNHIKGGPFDKAGGIAFLTFGGGARILIQDNLIEDNRFGIALYGVVDAHIINNEILNNNIENLPMVGGSGITLQGSSSIKAVVTQNRIKGNLWGITRYVASGPGAELNLGDTVAGGNPGLNEFENNVNYEYHNSGAGVNDTTFAIYNNASDDVMAYNNWWGASTVAGAEEVIWHKNDISSLGTVHFQPMLTSPVSSVQVESVAKAKMTVYPNPATDQLTVRFENQNTGNALLILLDMLGRKVKEQNVSGYTEFTLNLNGVQPGAYILMVSTGDKRETRKVLVQ